MIQSACTDGSGVCNLPLSLGADLGQLRRYVFQIAIKDFLDSYTFNVKQVMKCCVAMLVPDGRAILFRAYNSVGYREQVPEPLIKGAGNGIPKKN